MASSKVIAGDFLGKKIYAGNWGDLYIDCSFGFDVARRRLNKDWVKYYEVLDSRNIGKNGAAVIGLSAVGAALVGPVGLLAGAAAKSRSMHTVAISFKDGKKSLLELDDQLYKILLRSLFGLEYRG